MNYIQEPRFTVRKILGRTLWEKYGINTILIATTVSIWVYVIVRAI